ncbi:MAG: hypothetical protein ACXVH1_37995, partial [Solirubrobacteraceae bacterium]
VEVQAGHPTTEYGIGRDLSVTGELVARVEVGAAAPNDIAGTRSEVPRIAAARRAFAEAVRHAFSSQFVSAELRALVIRHLPQRDEDNTWATWIAAVCGIQNGGVDHWSAPAPLTGWRPTAVASLADERLTTPVVYEPWG